MVIWLCVLHAGLARLNAGLDAEYGERERQERKEKAGVEGVHNAQNHCINL